MYSVSDQTKYLFDVKNIAMHGQNQSVLGTNMVKWS